RIRAGDEEAFGVFFRMHYARVVGYVRSEVGDTDVAEEIAQDVFVGLWSNRETFAQSGEPERYLFRAARNRLLNHAARDKVARSYAIGLARMEAPGAPAADHLVHHDDLAAAIRTAVAALPPKLRATFMLSRAQGMSTAEIAAAQNISTKSVEQRLWRALTA